MRARSISMVVPLLLAALGRAQAAGLGWYDCGNAGGALQERFTCDTDTGAAHVAILSLPSHQDVDSVASIDVSIEFLSARAALPPWWELGPGGCRAGALRISTSFADPPLEAGICEDLWGGAGASVTLAYETNVSGDPRVARLEIHLMRRPGASVSLRRGIEYYLCALNIRNDATTGDGCSGCEEGVCIYVTGTIIRLTDGREVEDRTPGSMFWQNAGFYVDHGAWCQD